MFVIAINFSQVLKQAIFGIRLFPGQLGDPENQR